MAVILGLNAFHPDSSACLVIDGKLQGAVAEERLGTREKHSMAFPENAIKWVLRNSGVRLRDVTHVAIARNPRANAVAKLKYFFSDVGSGFGSVNRFMKRLSGTSSALLSLAENMGEDSAKCHFSIHPVEHHLAHIASAYFLSQFDSMTAGFSYDGSGDFVSAMGAACEGTNITVLDRVFVPNSLGFFYTAMCQFIGFDLFGEEYKVMGLAPYGENRFSDEMARILKVNNRFGYQLNRQFFTIERAMADAELSSASMLRLGRLFSSDLVALMGQPRDRRDPITQREMDVARSTQIRFEEAAMSCLSALSKMVPINRLAMAGGCSLNGVMNARVLRDQPVEQVFIQPAASDDGTALGAAYHCWHVGLRQSERFFMEHAYWGPEYSDADITAAIVGSRHVYRKFDTIDQTIEAAATLISKGVVLGWYQGRSEWGPRALGNRSILANPAVRDMKAIINSKIKKRESFRPFAPSVLREDVSRYFEQDVSSPFMMHVVKFKPEWRDVFPAVVHVDGTGRLQTVDKRSNALYYNLISAVKRKTGYGMVLNTSFNENEPIVDTPSQAVSCFERTDMDVLIMNNSILVKRNLLECADLTEFLSQK